MSRLAFQSDHILETGALWNSNRRIRLAGIFIADVFDEQQDEHIILVLRSIHAAAQFVAAFPEGVSRVQIF